MVTKTTNLSVPMVQSAISCMGPKISFLTALDREGMVWYGRAWFNIVWYGLVENSIIWYRMVC